MSGILEKRVADRDRRIVDAAQIGNLSVALPGSRDEFPTQAEVERQSRPELKIVLDISSDEILAIVPLEIRAGFRELEIPRRSGQKGLDGCKAQPSTASAVGESVISEVLEVDAALEMMPSRSPEDVVGELIEIL